MLRKAALVGCGGVVLGAVVLASKPEWRTKVVSTTDGTLRFLRTAWQAAAVAADYKYSFRNLEKGDEGYWELRERVDARAASRLLKVCKANGGVYTKMGQYLASMNHVLPPVFTETLSVLQDKASHRSIEEVSAVLDRELGVGAMKALFAEFAPRPVAAASLAQVHRAVTHDGREVAVKVQYPGLEAQVRADQFTTRFLVRCLGRAFPDFEFSWMLPEFEDNLRLELDFTQEARNSARVAAMFRGQRDVYVPPIFNELSTRRVLTMEFVRGVKPTNADALAAIGVSGREVAAKASRVFGDMIHVHGFVHCDPHPGNLLVRKDVEGNTQLVVLDHGMYRRLDQSFRAAYCRLWKGMILTDADLVQSAAREMGLGEFAEILPLLFIYRPVAGSSSTDVGKRMSPEQRQRLKQQFKGTTMKDVNLFLQRLPRDMLFVMRSTNLVRSLNKELGGTTRQRVRIMAESAIRGLALDHAYNRRHSSEAPGLVNAADADAEEHSHGGQVDVSGSGVDGSTRARDDTASVFAPHTINAAVDSEVAAAEGNGVSARAWLQLWWDVGRLRFRTMALDAWVGLLLWWRGIDLDAMDVDAGPGGAASGTPATAAEQRKQWSKQRQVAQMG